MPIPAVPQKSHAAVTLYIFLRRVYKDSLRGASAVPRGYNVLTTNLSSGFDEFLFGIPLIVLLFFGFFRLDETFTRKTRREEPQSSVGDPAPRGLDPRRTTPMSDPDGRPWTPRVQRRR